MKNVLSNFSETFNFQKITFVLISLVYIINYIIITYITRFENKHDFIGMQIKQWEWNIMTY